MAILSGMDAEQDLGTLLAVLVFMQHHHMCNIFIWHIALDIPQLGDRLLLCSDTTAITESDCS